jgi:pimeloyl-ACP methyl ester carboxylesterase
VSTYVLIHGAWQDGSCWAGVAAELRAAGHDVHAPTLAGQGRGDGVDRSVGHAEAVASAADAIVGADLRDVVLVGHSYGGTVVSRLAELLTGRLRRLVYVNAFVLLDGESVYDVSPPHYNELMDAVAAERGDDSVVLPYPVWREAFMNDADEALARTVYEEHLSPHPVQTFRDKIELKTFPTLEIPRSYVNNTEDIAMPPGEYGWHPRFSSRLGLYRLVQLPGGHETLYTNPQLLAEKIQEAGRD